MKERKKRIPRVKVLFVCTGNTCRSPMAEFIFKDYIRSLKLSGRITVSSAGICAEPGAPMTAEAAQALKDIHATDFSSHVNKYCVFRPYPIRINNNSNAGFIYTGDFDSGARFNGYNVYVYCTNNPANFFDPTGGFILTALIVGIVTGTVIGGAIGGTVAYNSARSSGLEGSDLFWATAIGVGKGAAIGGVAGGLIGATSGVVAAYGATSVIGTATITATSTVLARTTEVSILQTKKSMGDGDNGWQVANDCIDSVFHNAGKIVSPVPTKVVSTSFTYMAVDLTQNKVIPLGVGTFLKTTKLKIMPYFATGVSWAGPVRAFFCDDPTTRANQRGYMLR